MTNNFIITAAHCTDFGLVKDFVENIVVRIIKIITIN